MILVKVFLCGICFIIIYYFLGLAISSLLNINLDKEIGPSYISKYAANNAHMFYLICKSEKERLLLMELMQYLIVCFYTIAHIIKKSMIWGVPIAKRSENNLLRLPLWVEMNNKEIDLIIHNVLELNKIL